MWFLQMIKKAPEFRRREYIPEFEDTFKFFLGITGRLLSQAIRR
jgi:hypothetical protein